ncbi:MAG TPA: UDP-N-acetylmuramate dehydrogenase [Candidatus Paceibacterota bacterium]|nr:UDP-N-acetylmuramate dehydrogenase [Candidatus Paceibacterota bacterium]
MQLREHVPLSLLTTFKIGGKARYVAECKTVNDVADAVAFAKREDLPYVPLGEGSNLLAPDAGYPGVIIHLRIPDLSVRDDGLLVAGAGVVWDQAVRQAGLRGLWGIENLAGIPGTIGAAPVQNIGAYGAELADTLVHVDAYNARTNEHIRLTAKECALGYRESRFKREPELIITSVTLQLSRDGGPRIDYKDLATRALAGERLTTPKEIAAVVRSVRSLKFPDLREYGTGGSFFKNPIISDKEYEALSARYKGMPGFPVLGGVKVPLAWILDNVLALRGYALRNASLFERQPLVLVAHRGASASDIDALALDVAKKVFDATGIHIEREVRSLT